MALRPELPALPQRMEHLPVARGYPVPWFVCWLDDEDREVAIGQGRPEFRMMSRERFTQALRDGRCWNCGGVLGRNKAFVIGPMCLVNKINAEPPSHLDCAQYAAKGCPFLTRPHARRREDELTEKGVAAGMAIKRNPGVACVYVIAGPYGIKSDGKGGTLFDLPEPHRVEFYVEGRQARYGEVLDSIVYGTPLLLEVCRTDAERAEVHKRATEALSRYVVPACGGP